VGVAAFHVAVVESQQPADPLSRQHSEKVVADEAWVAPELFNQRLAILHVVVGNPAHCSPEVLGVLGLRRETGADDAASDAPVP
jgi:hypothetical protein